MRWLYLVTLILSAPAVAYEYSEEMVESFMDNCRQGSSKKYCRCALEYLQENYSASRVNAMGMRAANGNMTQSDIRIMQETAEECGGTFSQGQSAAPSTRTSGYDHVAAECTRLEKRIRDCNSSASKMRDN
ncbi:MAG TPA: hypothetical protein PKY05_02135, partial [Fibrobacteria bacterium]|nr:hypothetical protein [Fibrobacteria bacterium]